MDLEKEGFETGVTVEMKEKKVKCGDRRIVLLLEIQVLESKTLKKTCCMLDCTHEKAQ